MKILFTSVGRRIELIQAFRKAADELKIELTIIGADIAADAPALIFAMKHRLFVESKIVTTFLNFFQFAQVKKWIV